MGRPGGSVVTSADQVRHLAVRAGTWGSAAQVCIYSPRRGTVARRLGAWDPRRGAGGLRRHPRRIGGGVAGPGLAGADQVGADQVGADLIGADQVGRQPPLTTGVPR